MTRAFLTFFFGVSLAAEALALSPSQNIEIILPHPAPGQTIPPAPGQIIPPDRNFAWNPGMMSKGGIPNRTTVCATLSPIGGGTDDSAALQTAADSCPANQVLMLSAGTFIVNNEVIISTSITLRGAGPGVTILNKANGAHARFPIVLSGTNGIQTPQNPNGAPGSFTGSISGSTMTITAVGSGMANVQDIVSGTNVTVGTQIVSQLSGTIGGIGTYSVTPGGQSAASTTLTATYTTDHAAILLVGPSAFPRAAEFTAQALTADGQQGSYSVTISDATNFVAGTFVLLDELTNASWQSLPAGYSCVDSIGPGPCPPLVWKGDKVAWRMYYPHQNFTGDNSDSNALCPFQGAFVDCVTSAPSAFSWFSRTGRQTNEIKEIASVSGNTITFTSPLTISYRRSHTAQLTRFPATGDGRDDHLVTNVGVENLSMIGGANGSLLFANAAYSWVKHVDISQWAGEGVSVTNSFRVEIRDSFIHKGSWPQPGGAGYAISFANGSSEVLVENNIILDTCKDIVARASGSGSVIAYNYMDDAFDLDSLTWQEVSLNASHMAGSHHVLFEGNYAQNFDSDFTHGNAIYMTVFRNVLIGQRRDFTDTSNPRAAGAAYGSWWDSFIGNVLGRSGQMSGWSYTDPAMSCDSAGNNCTGNNANWGSPPSDIWKLGYDPGQWSMNPDPQTLATVIRDGNYDFLTNSQRWHNTPGTFVIPNSMYLSAKPAFFGNNPWPWSNPTTGTIYTLPAKARYDAGTPN